MSNKDEIQILTADFGFQQYLVILVAGFHQSTDYYQETFIIGEGEPAFYYERRDEDNAPEGKTHEEKCRFLLRLGLLDAKNQLKQILKKKYELTNEILYYQARNEVDNLKTDDEGWLLYLQRTKEINDFVKQIKARTKSDELKTILKQQK